MSCSPDIAQAIVDLLMADPGVTSSWNRHREPRGMVAKPIKCRGCGTTFKRKRRQFCSRDCWERYVERRKRA